MGKNKRQVILFSVFCFLFSVLSGCGYTTRSMISTKYRKIYVTPFVNKIDFTQENAVANRYKVYRPMLEREVTKAVVDKYIFDGNLRPVEEEAADLVLEGELIDFRRDPVRYTEDDDIEEYRLNIIVNIKLIDRKTEELVWQENGFIGETTYFTMGAQIKSEDVAVNDAIKDLARRIVERTVEQW
ncbi:MAG: LptE family protein [Candidatus Omnitrophota bacterium]